MLTGKRLTHLMLGLSTFILVFASCASSAQSQTINGVGFASMQRFSFESKAWSYAFSQLARQGYAMKYSSFRQVAEKVQVQNMRPMTLEIPVNRLVLPANTETVQEFHQQFLVEAERYLENLALVNNAALIIFDYIDAYSAELYVEGYNDVLPVEIFVYYLDSNAMAFEMIELNQREFSETRVDFGSLRSKLHSAILDALEDAVINTSGIITGTRQTAPLSGGTTAEENGNFWD